MRIYIYIYSEKNETKKSDKRQRDIAENEKQELEQELQKLKPKQPT